MRLDGCAEGSLGGDDLGGRPMRAIGVVVGNGAFVQIAPGRVRDTRLIRLGGRLNCAIDAGQGECRQYWRRV